jgi:hypothetical protein
MKLFSKKLYQKLFPRQALMVYHSPTGFEGFIGFYQEIK